MSSYYNMMAPSGASRPAAVARVLEEIFGPDYSSSPDSSGAPNPSAPSSDNAEDRVHLLYNSIEGVDSVRERNLLLTEDLTQLEERMASFEEAEDRTAHRARVDTLLINLDALTEKVELSKIQDLERAQKRADWRDLLEAEFKRLEERRAHLTAENSWLRAHTRSREPQGGV